MLQPAPTTISSSSARSTEPYQTLAAWPSFTLPTTTAPGATQASGWIEGACSPMAPINPETIRSARAPGPGLVTDDIVPQVARAENHRPATTGRIGIGMILATGMTGGGVSALL